MFDLRKYFKTLKYSLNLNFTLQQATKEQRGVDVQLCSFFNLGTIWRGWSRPRSGRFFPGKETQYSLYRRLGGPQGRAGQLRKTSPPPGFDPRKVQPVASRYMEYLTSWQSVRTGVHPWIKKKVNKVRNVPNVSTKFVLKNHNIISFSNLFLRIKGKYVSQFPV